MPLCPQLWEENEEVETKRGKKKNENLCASLNFLSFNGFFPMLQISDDTIWGGREICSEINWFFG
jgi:hypothetical protein